MKTYVAETYGDWDEEYQTRRFDDLFARSDGEVIVVAGCDVGYLRLERRSDLIRLLVIEIAPEHQGSGIGTAVVSDLLGEAAESNVPVTLQVLRANPARHLYERLGFSVTGESDTHIRMECQPSSNALGTTT